MNSFLQIQFLLGDKLMSRDFMKLFISIFIFLFSTQILPQSYSVPTVPNPRQMDGGFISNPDKIMDDADYQIANTSLLNLEKETGVEFAIVMVRSIGDSVPKDFAVELFNHWGIGKKGKDNGLLLLIVMDQRRYEFETGYGLEGILTDIYLKHVGEEKIVPNMKAGNHNSAILSTVTEIVSKLKGEATELSNLASNEEDFEKILLVMEERNNFHSFSWDIVIYLFMYSSIVYLFQIFINSKPLLFKGLFSYKSNINWKLISVFFSPLVFYFIYLIYENLEVFLPILRVTGIYFGLLILFYLIDWLIHSNSESYSDPYKHYQKIEQFQKNPEFIVPCILFPIPILFILGYILWKKRNLRYAPRISEKSQKTMVRLDEVKDDLFLEKGQILEESIGSVDYDVWFCEESNDVKIYAYESMFTSYTKCPSCSYKTKFLESDTVLVSSTCTSSGRGVRNFACKNCNYKNSENYTIPQRDCTKSSGSSSGSSYRSSSSSSSSSSSFGGGRSGGGGAGGSW
jgi:uncharacterized protein